MLLSGNVNNLQKRLSAVFIMALIVWSITPPTVCADDSQQPFSSIFLKSRLQELQKDEFQLSLASCYYRYKTDEADWMYTGLLLRAYLAKNWELALGSNFLSYQHPDFGVADVYAGLIWTFYDRDNRKLAVSGYLNFPTGSPAFRNPGIQPTLSLIVSQTTGAFEFGATFATTYAADSQGDTCYFDFENTLTVDYSPDDKNSFGLFTYGYFPDQRKNGLWRLSAGASYTRTFNKRHASSLTFEKGVSGRGLDWSVTLGYDFVF